MSGEYILVAEDNPGDVFLIRESLKPLGLPLKVAHDGDQVFALLDGLEADHELSTPALLDLNLPKRPGIEVLQRLRRSPHVGSIPVVVISSSDYQRDRDAAAALGIDHYFRKPSDLDAFFQLVDVVRPLLASR